MSTVLEDDEIRWCEAVVAPGSWHVDPTPPEYCDNEAVEGSAYCRQHLEEYEGLEFWDEDDYWNDNEEEGPPF